MAKRVLSLTLGVALAAGITSVATATSASAAGECAISASKLTVTATDTTRSNTSVKAWDQFKVAYSLKDLDGLTTGSCITFSAPETFREIPGGSLDLKAPDGSLIGTQSITDGTVTVTLTTDYAATHQNVSVWGSYTARIDDTIAVGSRQPLTFTVNGTITTTTDVTTTTCVDCSAMLVGEAQKYGFADNGTGTVYVAVPVVAKAGTKVTVSDTFTSAGQSLGGTPTAVAFTSKNAWGGMVDAEGRTVTTNPDGSWTVETTRDAESIRLAVPMTFTGTGPWTDVATVVVDGHRYTAAAKVVSSSADGAGRGELAPTPAPSPTPTPTPAPVDCTCPGDVPVAPKGEVAPQPPARRTPVRMRTYVAQVDTYGWRSSPWFGNRIASFDDDGRLRYREDGFLWMSRAAKKYSSYGHTFVTFTAPVTATKAQLVKAYNAKAPASLRITTTAKLGRIAARTGRVTDVWVLGKRATPQLAWGSKHDVGQVYIGRR